MYFKDQAKKADKFLCCGLIVTGIGVIITGIGWIIGRDVPKLAAKDYENQIDELCRMYDI